MKQRLLKYAPYVGYPVFYVVCLLIFAALTFPYDKLKQRIVAAFNAEQHGPGGQELQIDEMAGYWLSGVRVQGVRLLSASTEPGKPPSTLEIDQASVRYSILSALIGNSDVGFRVNAFGGEASGSYSVHGKERSLELTLDSIDLGAVEPLVQTLGVPLKGALNGNMKLVMPEGKTSKAAGAVAFEATNVAVGDGKAKIKGALALPTVNVGTLTFTGEAKDGSLKITKLAAGGKDLELSGEGRVTLRETAGESVCDAQVRFKINDAYRTKSDVTKSLFGAPGSTIPPLFELADPKVKQAKRADGFYGWTVRGPLAHLDFVPAGGAGAAPGLPGAPRP